MQELLLNRQEPPLFRLPLMDFANRSRTETCNTHPFPYSCAFFVARALFVCVHVGFSRVQAVGVRVKRWVTMHGLSLNVHPDLGHFQHIVPCGIGDRPVGSRKETFFFVCVFRRV